MTVVMAVASEDVNAEPSWRGQEYGFVDEIDTWTCDGTPHGLNDAVLILQGCPLVYEHDITDAGVPNQYHVSEAWLELDFTNDVTDAFGSIFCGLIRWDFRESARVGFDGDEWQEITDVDNGFYELVLDIDWLNDDGILDVTITVSNPLGTATAWLDHSVLYGNLVAVPAPAAVLLGLLGLAAAGRKLRKHA
ncbi:MAG: hypothetical protein ABFE13_26625 [Phycisphaerales bacterium]